MIGKESVMEALALAFSLCSFSQSSQKKGKIERKEGGQDTR
jgi:hypothetical protein